MKQKNMNALISIFALKFNSLSMTFFSVAKDKLWTLRDKAETPFSCQV